MFSNFKDTFIRKPQYTSEPPKAVIDAISKDLPDGFNYVYESNGFCRIDADNGFNIKSGKILLSEEAKNILPQEPTIEQIKQYSYNSQTKIAIAPDDDGCFEINGKRIKAEKLISAPLENYRFENINFYMEPAPFPPPFEMVFSGNKYKKTMHIHRTPNKSLNVQRYESEEKEPLSVVYYVNVTEEKFTFTLNINVKNAKSVYDVLSSYKIYNAFIDGHGSIADTKVSNIKNVEKNRIPQEAIEFWEKLYKIEQFFNMTFDITNNITVADIRYVEEIYRCILKKKPYKSFKEYSSLKGKGTSKSSSNNIPINKEILFEFKTYRHYELLGQVIELKSLCGIFGASIKNVIPGNQRDNNNITIMLQPADGERMYESVMLFLTDQELEDFRNDKDHINLMKNAEEITLLE